MTSRLVSAIAAFGIAAALLIAPTAAQAVASHHKVVQVHNKKAAKKAPHKAAKKAPKKAAKKHVPTCPGYAHRSRSTVMVTDTGNYNASSLYQAMVRLICSAADHSTIDVRMYFAYFQGAAPNGIARALRLMHDYHHVRVDILEQTFPEWQTITRAKVPFAHLYTCTVGCQAGTAASKAHSKWIAVSQMRNHNGPGVLITSSNISVQQLSTWESGTVSIGDRALYLAVTGRMRSDMRCAAYGCRRPALPVAWQHTSEAGVDLYFSPTSSDPVATQLTTMDCTGGGTIYYASLEVPRHAVLAQLVRLQAQGCVLRLVIEHRCPPHTGVTWRYKYQHNKLLSVQTRTGSVVMTGTDNFTPNGVAASDNLTLRITQPALVTRFVRYARAMWDTSSAGLVTIPPSRS